MSMLHAMILAYFAVASTALGFGPELGFMQVSGGNEPAAKIAPGEFHTCVLLANGTVRCWGQNDKGQLGYDSTTSKGNVAGSMESLNTVNLGAGKMAKAIAAGGYQTCAILDDNTVKCWGRNDYGQLGLDDTTDRGTSAGSMAALASVNLGAGRTAKAIGVGSRHACAVLDDNSVKCWGRNNYGQLGLDSTQSKGAAAGDMASLPTVNLGAGRTAKVLKVGSFHTCAILDDNSLKCWGRNEFGQLGLDDAANRGDAAGSMSALAAINLGAGRTAKAVALGSSYTCAILDNDSLKCWGSNYYGQLGLDERTEWGSSTGSMAALQLVNLGAGRTAKAVTAGDSHTCAILDNDSLKCWGRSDFGQTGEGNNASRGDEVNEMQNLPLVNLGSGRKAKAVEAGPRHTCAILDNDAIMCWGRNVNGQLGLDSVDPSRGSSAGNMASLPVVNLGLGRTAKAVSAGWYYSCAILDNNSVKCWGDNTYGQLGQDSTVYRGISAGDMAALPAVNLGTSRTAKSISAGKEHVCVILDNDSVKCWGHNSCGELGLDSNVVQGANAGDMAALPTVNLGSGHTAKAISSGGDHTCAILDNNSVKCWGASGAGQLGRDGTDCKGNAPGEMAALAAVNLGVGRTAKAIAAGDTHSCAILDDNSLKCWGGNSFGELGLDSTTNQGGSAGEMAALPTVNLGSGRTAKAIATGWSATCALLDNNSVKCWGKAGSGELGRDSTDSKGGAAGDMAALTPVNLGSGRTAKSIATGNDSVCAVLDDNSLKCWGRNDAGGLGIDSSTHQGISPGDMAALPTVNLGVGRTVNPLVIQNVAAGVNHTCAVLDDNSLKCWGQNYSGQLGLDSVGTWGNGGGLMSNTPIALP